MRPSSCCRRRVSPDLAVLADEDSRTAPRWFRGGAPGDDEPSGEELPGPRRGTESFLGQGADQPAAPGGLDPAQRWAGWTPPRDLAYWQEIISRAG